MNVPPPKLRIADIGAVECKDRLDAALPIDRELLRKVRGTARIRRRPRGQQKQLAEIAFVQWNLADRFTGQLFSPGGCLLLRNANEQQHRPL